MGLLIVGLLSSGGSWYAAGLQTRHFKTADEFAAAVFLSLTSHYSIYSTGLGKPTKKTSCLPSQNIQNLCGIYLNKLIYTLGVTLERTLTKLCCLLPSVFMKKDTKQLILRIYFYFVIWSVSYFQDPVGLTNVSTLHN